MIYVAQAFNNFVISHRKSLFQCLAERAPFLCVLSVKENQGSLCGTWLLRYVWFDSCIQVEPSSCLTERAPFVRVLSVREKQGSFCGHDFFNVCYMTHLYRLSLCQVSQKDAPLCEFFLWERNRTLSVGHNFVYMCDMTHLYRSSLQWLLSITETWLFEYVRHDSFI